VKRLRVIVVLGISMVGILTACSSSSEETTSASTTVVNEPRQVSIEEVKIATKSIDVYVDEFEGWTVISPKLMNFAIGERKFDETLNLAGVSLSIVSDNVGDNWKANLTTAYFNKDWLFHNTFNLKSSDGVLNLTLDIRNRDEVVNDGYVSETNTIDLTPEDVVKYCTIVNGDDIKIRLRGPGGPVYEVVKDMPLNIAQSQRDMCTVYFGLKQGIELQK
jgi:hypothetical protein